MSRYSVIFCAFLHEQKWRLQAQVSRRSDHDSSVSRATNCTAQAESSNCRFPRAIVVFRGRDLWPPLFFPHTKWLPKITDYRDTAVLKFAPTFYHPLIPNLIMINCVHLYTRKTVLCACTCKTTCRFPNQSASSFSHRANGFRIEDFEKDGNGLRFCSFAAQGGSTYKTFSCPS